MNCPNCQKDIAAGSKFCYNCGAKQPEAAAPSAPPAYNSRKRLVRSINDRKIAGVCAGVADYFDLDPPLVRRAGRLHGSILGIDRVVVLGRFPPGTNPQFLDFWGNLVLLFPFSNSG